MTLMSRQSGLAGLPRRALPVVIVLLALAACRDDAMPSGFQGYGEGDYTYLSAFEAGALTAVPVARGDRVTAGQPLFTLDSVLQASRLREADGRLESARHDLANMMQGKRQQEIDVLIAGRNRAEASLRLSKENLERRTKLRRDGVISENDIEQAQAAYDRDRASLDEIIAQVAAAQLTARIDEIGAAEAAVETTAAVQETARWYLDQRRVAAPVSGRVEDVLFDVGEFVQPGQPVVSLLADNALKVRFFIPEARLGEVHAGQAVVLVCDGCPAGLTATVRYIATSAEYTPPVIFSQPSQQKLVFMAEAWPDGAAPFHPGQPVEVRMPEPAP